VRIFKDFNEVKAAVGTEVRVSDWVEVTLQRIDQFAQRLATNNGSTLT
jgi:acyl dehydratase